jgi:hypothetical protein
VNGVRRRLHLDDPLEDKGASVGQVVADDHGLGGACWNRLGGRLKNKKMRVCFRRVTFCSKVGLTWTKLFFFFFFFFFFYAKPIRKG